MKKIFLNLLILSLSFNSYAQQWVEQWGVEDTFWTHSVVYDFFPEGDTLYVGGGYYYEGSDTLIDIGKWDGQNWHKMGFGINNSGGAQKTLRYKGKIYTGGEFLDFYAAPYTQIPTVSIPGTYSIARWNDTINSWEALPNTYGGLDWGNLHDMIIYNDTLFMAAEAPTGAPWSGSTRVTAYDADINNYIDIGKLPSTVHAFAILNGELYAGGTWFSVRKYIGGTGYEAWIDVGGSINYYLNDMAVDTFNNFLYIAGGFWAVDDTILTDNVAIWNGYYWEKVGYGYNEVQTGGEAVEIYNGDVYLGRFCPGPLGGVNINSSLVRWDGQDWHAIGPLNNGVFSLEVWNDKLYIGGNFDSLAGQPIIHRGIACWMDTTHNCRYLKPRIYTDNMKDTFYISNDSVNVNFYNNNTYADAWYWDFGDTGTDTIKDPNHIFTQTGTYTVSVTVTHGVCSKTVTKDITITSGAKIIQNNRKRNGFKLYPNPTKNILYVEIYDYNLLNSKIKILNINGKEIKTLVIDNNKLEIDISNLTNGVYFVKTKNQIERFVKN